MSNKSHNPSGDSVPLVALPLFELFLFTAIGREKEMVKKIEVAMEMEMGANWRERETEIAVGRRR